MQRPQIPIKFINASNVSPFVVIAIIALLSLASYYLVEKRSRHREKILKPAFFAFSVSLSLSVLLYTSHFSYDSSVFDKVVWWGNIYNVSPNNTWPASFKRRMEGIVMPERESCQTNAYATGGIIKDYGGTTPEIVVIGDSHALMWSGVVDMICKELSITVSFYAADGTPPFINLPLKKPKGKLIYFSAEDKYVFDKKRLEYIRDWKPKIIILVSKWAYVEDIHIADDLIQYIGKNKAQIILIEQPPVLFFGDRNAPQYLAYMGVHPKGNQKQYIKTTNSERYERGRELIRELSKKYTYCKVMSVADVFYRPPTSACVLEGSHVLYIDDDHLSQDGAMKLKDRLYEMIRNALNS